MAGRRLPIVVALAILISVAGCGTPFDSDSPPSTTRIHLFEPFTGLGSATGPIALAAGLTVTQTLTGSCRRASAIDDRPDAWRCAARGIHDPCFALPVQTPTKVACVAAPWSGSVTLIRLVTPPPQGKANPFIEPSQIMPWAITLANGNRCVYTLSSRLTVAGFTELYDCGHGHIVFNLNQNRQPWTAYVTTPSSPEVSVVALSDAWD